MDATDATRLAGDAYGTRLARSELPPPDDKTRLAQQGYESRLARDADRVQPVADEFYKIGEKIGNRYEVSAIHHGAMGVVYGCFDHETKLPRALKTVRACYANDKQALSLFESEAFVWVSLEKHPYIVRAYRVERFSNLPYVITEYVCGQEGMEGDLRGWLGHPRLTLPVAVTMALQIAQGMQHAVRKMPGLVHRDLKPANILVNSEAKAMVTDFGLVLAGSSDAGTPAYMSPEQWRGEDLDMRSDIYAYGCILFEMFTAHRLFAAVTEKDWETAHLENVPVALGSSVKELPTEINHFLCRCLEKTKVARPQDWDEVVAFFAEWYHRLTGKSVVFDFSTLALNVSEMFDLGYSLNKLNHHEEAIQAYERVLLMDPNYVHVWYNKGLSLSKLKRYKEAIQVFDRAIMIDQNISPVWNSKGNALCKLNRFEEANIAYDRALIIDPNMINTLNNKSIALHYSNDYNEEIKICDNVILIDSNNYIAWLNKGNAFNSLKHYECAITAYDRALTINPYCSGLLLKKGNALNALRRYEEAVKTFDQELVIDPNCLDAWLNKGNALNNLKRYEESVVAYDGALAIQPNNSNAWLKKGNVLKSLKRYEEAVKALSQALTIDSNNLNAWNSQGSVLNGLNRYDEAIKACDRALLIDPNSLLAWTSRGYALIHLMNYSDAVAAFDHVLRIDPKNSYAMDRKKYANSLMSE